MTYGDFCKLYKIEPSPDAFVVWLYFSYYSISRENFDAS